MRRRPMVGRARPRRRPYDGPRPLGRAAAPRARTLHGAGRDVPLVHASGESLPFTENAFDIVFCDHGAMSFCEPARILPEVARVLRPEGMLAFCATHPLVYLTWSSRQERQSRKLHMDYDQLGRIAFGDGTIDWVLPPGEWITLLRATDSRSSVCSS